LEAKNHGLVDDLCIFDEFHKEKYPGVKVVDFSKSNPWESALENFQARMETMIAERLNLW